MLTEDEIENLPQPINTVRLDVRRIAESMQPIAERLGLRFKIPTGDEIKSFGFMMKAKGSGPYRLATITIESEDGKTYEATIDRISVDKIQPYFLRITGYESHVALILRHETQAPLEWSIMYQGRLLDDDHIGDMLRHMLLHEPERTAEMGERVMKAGAPPDASTRPEIS